jgi:galactokinase
MKKENLAKTFQQQYGSSHSICVQAPGRVNLIGEHTDYNDGFVFPAAIDRYVTVLASPRPDRLIRAFSVDFEQATEFFLGDIEPSDEAPWSNFVRGVLVQFQKRGADLPGADLIISGNVPIGAGLSSSAAIEVAVAEAFRVLGDLQLNPVEKALLSQAAEHEFVGVKCGIMDQFISALAQRGTALFLDCRDLSYSAVPLSEGLSIVVCNSAVERRLDSSEYNRRRSECERAVEVLNQKYGGIEALRDASLEQLEEVRPQLGDVPYRRARHVISENNRVLEAVEALTGGKTQEFGALLYSSHSSLRDDYEVSCKELDILVDLARRAPGIVGARMTGAGFGGCTVNLVESSAVQEFCDSVQPAYFKETGIQCPVYVCLPSAGAGACG